MTLLPFPMQVPMLVPMPVIRRIGKGKGLKVRSMDTMIMARMGSDGMIPVSSHILAPTCLYPEALGISTNDFIKGRFMFIFLNPRIYLSQNFKQICSIPSRTIPQKSPFQLSYEQRRSGEGLEGLMSPEGDVMDMMNVIDS